MSGDPLQPVLGGDVPFDGTAFEVESRAEFDTHLRKKSFADLVGRRFDVRSVHSPFPWTMVAASVRTS